MTLLQFAEPHTEAAERARQDFRQDGSEDAFKAALRRLGFEEMAILIEVECNRPVPMEVETWTRN